MAVDYGEDFLQRITGVHWREKQPAGLPYATFVFGGLSSEGGGLGGVYTVTATKEDLKDTSPDAKYRFESGMKLISLVDTFESVASSYALIMRTDEKDPTNKTLRPTFLVAGNKAEFSEGEDNTGNPIRVTTITTLIYRSSDGLNWSQVFEGSPVISPPGLTSYVYGNPVALVWDPASEAFYFDVNRGNRDVTLMSKDGTDWGEISSVDTGGSADYRSAFPPTYCSQNDCFDDNGNNVPDGVMKHDLDAKLTIKPEQPPIISYGQGGHSFDSSSDGVTYGGPGIVVNDEFLLKNFTTSVPFPKVFGVAGLHNIWMAAGSNDQAGDSGALAASTDRGRTWTVYAAPAGGIHTIVAGAYG
jgi:hypothetical protein